MEVGSQWMHRAMFSGGRRRRRALAAFLDEVAHRVPGLRIGGTRVRLLSLAAFAWCEAVALVRYRQVWREEPRAAIRRTVLLLPVVLALLAAATALLFALGPLWAAVGELSLVVAVVGVLLTGPGWVRLIDARRAGLAMRVMTPLEGRTRIALGSFWAYPPGHGNGRRLMNAVLTVADARGVLVELDASCWRLVDAVYRRDGFEPLPGKRRAATRRLRREPMARTARHRA